VQLDLRPGGAVQGNVSSKAGAGSCVSDVVVPGTRAAFCLPSPAAKVAGTTIQFQRDISSLTSRSLR
jgi:hypothetical protein